MKDLRKLIKTTIREFLLEGYYRQNYYHYTDYRNFMNIIIMDELKEGNIKGISLTRDKFLHKHTDYLPTSIRFELNGDLLNNNFKIKPFMDNNLQTKDGDFIGIKWKGNPEIDYDFLEFEERVISDKIKPLSKYLVNISIEKFFFDEIIKNTNFIEYINNHNISFNLLK
jgi:hypothetical protein